MKLTREELYKKKIDSHAHAGISLNYFYDDKYPYCCSVLEINDKIEKSGFDYACVFPFPSYIWGDNISIDKKHMTEFRKCFESIPYKKENEKLLLEIERFKLEKMLPFAMFSINYSIDEQIEYLESVGHKIYGLKYYPDADARRISELSSLGKPFLDYLIKNNIPLIIHVSENACLYEKGYSNVMDVIELSNKYPRLRIAVAHMGHFSRKAVEHVIKHNLNNFYFDLSPFLHICHIRTVNSGDVLDLNYENPFVVLDKLVELLPNNLIWGSDIPFNFTCNIKNSNHNFEYYNFSVEKNVEILMKLEQEKVMKICSNNTIELLFGEKK